MHARLQIVRSVLFVLTTLTFNVTDAFAKYSVIQRHCALIIYYSFKDMRLLIVRKVFSGYMCHLLQRLSLQSARLATGDAHFSLRK